MNTKYELNMEILSSIDNIDDVVMESEIDVMCSLADVYSKQAMILEHYEGSYDNAVKLYTESVGSVLDKMDSKLAKKDDESLIKKILLLIPRAINKIIQLIRKKFTNKESKFSKLIDELENLSDEPIIVVDDENDDFTEVKQEAFFGGGSKSKSTGTTMTRSQASRMSSALTVAKKPTEEMLSLSNQVNNVIALFKDTSSDKIVDYLLSNTTTPAQMAKLESTLPSLVNNLDATLGRWLETITDVSTSKAITKAKNAESDKEAMKVALTYTIDSFKGLLKNYVYIQTHGAEVSESMQLALNKFLAKSKPTTDAIHEIATNKTNTSGSIQILDAAIQMLTKYNKLMLKFDQSVVGGLYNQIKPFVKFI